MSNTGSSHSNSARALYLLIFMLLAISIGSAAISIYNIKQARDSLQSAEDALVASEKKLAAVELVSNSLDSYLIQQKFGSLLSFSFGAALSCFDTMLIGCDDELRRLGALYEESYSQARENWAALNPESLFFACYTLPSLQFRAAHQYRQYNRNTEMQENPFLVREGDGAITIDETANGGALEMVEATAYFASQVCMDEGYELDEKLSISAARIRFNGRS